MAERRERYNAHETAVVTLALDDAIAAYRQGRTTGLPCLDQNGASLVSNNFDSLFGLNDESQVLPHLGDRLCVDEIAVLTTLASVYGPTLLDDGTFGSIVRLIACQGGIRLVQRVLWGEAEADISLALMLSDVQAPFEELTKVWPDVFMR
jgi:hypothetical protein